MSAIGVPSSNETAADMPHRAIFNDVDMRAFSESSTKKDLLQFVEAMGKSCTSGVAPGFDPQYPLVGLTPSMACLHGSLRQMITWVDDFPPANPEAARFGNPAFRSWHGRLLERSHAIIAAILTARQDEELGAGMEGQTLEEHAETGYKAAGGLLEFEQDPSIGQVSCFLHDSFGHATRLDYGTGHESSFVVFLLVLSKVACFGKTPSLETLRATTLSIFNQYLKLTRRLQTDYRLEPAGSHGVWGLDDYHCLPFYFGACQLQATGVSPHELLSPKCILDRYLLKSHCDEYLYLSCIRHVQDLKQGVPFFESSPMLNDISSLTTWAQVTRGLLRLYQGEVLEKRQVVQHFLFSNFFPATWKPSKHELRAPPLNNFREPSTTNGGPAVVSTTAPWSSMASEPGMAPTRAPWANDPVAGMAPTRAPWADEHPAGMAPMRAPWASDNTSAMAPTRAPWASNDTSGMAPTRAPWADNDPAITATTDL